MAEEQDPNVENEAEINEDNNEEDPQTENAGAEGQKKGNEENKGDNKEKPKKEKPKKEDKKEDTKKKDKKEDTKMKDKKEDPKKDAGKKDDNAKTDSQPGGAGDIVTDFVEDVWKVMTPELLDRLRCVLIEDLGLSKQDADKFLQSQKEIQRQRICLQKDKRVVRIGPRNLWIKELSRDIANPMASFLVGILLSIRTARTKKLAEKILERLCQLTGEKTTAKKAKTKIQRILVVIADRMATYLDEAITEMEREMKKGPSPSIEDSERKSVATTESTETFTPSEGDEVDLENLTESQLELLLSREGGKRVSILSEGETISEEESEKGGVEGDEEELEPKEGSEEAETTEEESEDSAEGDAEEEVSEEAEEEEESKEEAEEEEESKEDEKEEKVDEEEDEEEEEESSSSSEEEEEGEGEDESGEEKGEEDEERKQLDILKLLLEDIERTPKGEGKTDRQMAVKDIIEKRFEKIAKDKLDKSLDSIVRLDIDQTASIVANWLEKILPAGDIVPKLPSEPSGLIKKQGSAFEVIVGDGSEFQVNKVSSTTVAQKVAETRGINFPIRKKKLPRSMSPLNVETTKDWADWALEAANVGEEWGKWLDNALEDIEKRLVDRDAQEKNVEDQKKWRDSLEHEAQKWRAEKHKIKGEAYLWNKKMESRNPGGKAIGKPVGPEKETRVVNY